MGEKDPLTNHKEPSVEEGVPFGDVLTPSSELSMAEEPRVDDLPPGLSPIAVEVLRQRMAFRSKVIDAVINKVNSERPEGEKIIPLSEAARKKLLLEKFAKRKSNGTR